MIDPNIALMGKLPEIDNPLDTQQKVLTMKNMMNTNSMNDLLLKNQQRADSDAEAVRQAFSNNVTQDEAGNPTVNRQGVMTDLYKNNAPAAMAQQQAWTTNDVAVAKMQRENQKAALENQGLQLTNAKNDLENRTRLMDRGAQLLGSSVDQPTYTANRAQAIAEGIPGFDKIPESYDPSYVKSMVMKAAGPKAQLEAQQKAIDQQLTALGLANTAQHNRAEEGIGMLNAGKQQFNANRDATMKLNSEFTNLPTVKTFQSTKENWDKVQALGKTGGLSDLGLIEANLRMYNPGVSVRSGTLTSAEAKAQGAPDRIVGMLQKIENGGFLAPEVRQSMVEEMGRIYKTQAGAVGDLARQYRDTAQRQGLNPDDAVPDFSQSGGNSGLASGKQAAGTKTMSSQDAIALSKATGKSVDEIVQAARLKGYTVQ